jgi:DNA-binding NarL/FixJ family response regulator
MQRDREELRVIRVLVVAHSIVIRAGLEALITTEPSLTIVGSTAHSDSLAQQIEQLQPEVVLLEWTAQDDELLLTLTSADTGLSPVIVLLIEDSSDSTLAEFLRAGIRGMLPIEATANEIVGAIVAAATGLTVLHPDVIDVLLPALPATRSLPEMPTQALTTREVEVLGMLAEGLGNKTIARRLTLSEHTVKFHISSIFSKLNASSRTEAVILGARQGLILL